jgi:hypothetical protein
VQVELWIDNVRKGVAQGAKIKDAQMQVARSVYFNLKKGK